MSLTMPSGHSTGRAVSATVMVALILLSGANLVPNALATVEVSSSPGIHVTALNPVSQFSLTEWSIPTAGGGPVGVVVEPSGVVWVTENSTSKLARFDPSNNNFTEWSTPTSGSQPRYIFFKQVNVAGVNRTQLFFTEYASNAIARFDVSNRTFTEWPLSSGSNPVGIFVDEHNDVWFTESGRDAIGRIVTGTNNLTEWTLPGATSTPGSPLLKPWGIYVQVVLPAFASQPNRFVWFTESANNKVGRLESTSGRLTIWDLNSLGQGSYAPRDITIGVINSVQTTIFSNFNSNRISVMSNDTGGLGASTYNEAIITTTAAGPTTVTYDPARYAAWFPEINAGNIANLNTTAFIPSITLGATYCTIAPNVGSPSCASPALRSTAIKTPTVTSNVVGVSGIHSPALSTNVGIHQSLPNGITEYQLPNVTARPSTLTLDYQGNVWFTESNVTVNRIGRFSLPFIFQISSPTTPQTVGKGQVATYSVNVGVVNGAPASVQLAMPIPPPGVTPLFNPQSQTPPFTSTLTLSTSNSTPPGTYMLAVTGTSGSQSHTTTITLIVQAAPQPPPPAVFDYSISLTSQPTVMIQQGGSAYFDMQVMLVSGNTQLVNLAAASGLPGAVTYQFNSSSGLPTFASRLSIQTTSDTPAGSYTITITGTSSGTTAHHPAASPVLVVTEVPRDFTISSSMSQIVLVQASRMNVPITVTATGAFSGDIHFDSSFSPTGTGLGVIFNPYTVTLSVGGTDQTIAEIVAFKNTVGTYQLTITGTSSNPSRTHSVVISLRVSPCLIATATFGSELAPEVQFLRDFRDQQIMQTFAGSNFMDAFNAWYYSFSPAVAGYEYSHATTRAIIKGTLYPLMGILHLSSSTYAAFSAEPEAAALLAGLVASSLIGLAYLALPVSGTLWLIRRKINGRTRTGAARAFAIALIALTAGFVIAELFGVSLLMMFASAGLVLTTLLAGSVLPALELVQFAKRRTRSI